MNVPPPRGTNPAAEDRARQACRGFEEMFLRSLLKEMRSTVPSSPWEERGPAREIVQDLYDQSLSAEMSRAGGVGLGRLLERQLQRTQDAALKADKESERRAHP